MQDGQISGALLAKRTGILIRNETLRYLEMACIVFSTHSPRHQCIRPRVRVLAHVASISILYTGP